MHFVAIGEILFDVMNKDATLGGAPLNVASHVKKLGSQSTIVSAVGDDELGRRARREIAALGVSTENIQTSTYPTGRADVVLTDGNADYTFNEPCAWDDISYPSRIPQKVDALYWGTLVQRGAKSRETLKKLIAQTQAPLRFYDVNIRKHYYTPEILKDGITHATILKMNEEEVGIVSKAIGIQETAPEEAIKRILAAYPVEKVLLTLGKEGCALFSKEGKTLRRSCWKVNVVDTVWAGDSLSAAFISTLLKGGTLEEALEKGTLLANYVCEHSGAIPEYDEAIKGKLGLD